MLNNDKFLRFYYYLFFLMLLIRKKLFAFSQKFIKDKS